MLKRTLTAPPDRPPAGLTRRRRRLPLLLLGVFVAAQVVAPLVHIVWVHGRAGDHPVAPSSLTALLAGAGLPLRSGPGLATPHPAVPGHDESNCPVCAQLVHPPVFRTAPTPVVALELTPCGRVVIAATPWGTTPAPLAAASRAPPSRA